MKRSDAARLVGLGVAFWAACSGGAAWAQTAAPTETTVPAMTNSDDPQIEAAKREVQAYEAAYRKMEDESGFAAAMRFFLTPDYKNVDVSGKSQSRDEWIAFLVKAFAKIDKQEAAVQKAPPIEKPAKEPSSLAQTPSATVVSETVKVENNLIILTQHHDGTTIYAPSSDHNSKAPSHEWRIVETERKVFRRTPNGLRLQEDAVVSMKLYLDGKFYSQQPFPRLPK